MNTPYKNSTSTVSKATANDAGLSLEHREDGIAILWIDVPGQPVNTLRTEFVPQLQAICAEVERSTEISGLVIASRKADSFIAGADLTMLEAVHSEAAGETLSHQAQAAMTSLAALRKPVVAAIHGTCLGGGLELALACHGRVASDHSKTRLGLPEVQLGILPGAGGTQRLPRLIGLHPAIDMLLTGKQIDARRAKKLGLVDEVVPEAILLKTALLAAKKRSEAGAATTKTVTQASQKRRGGLWKSLQPDWSGLQEWAQSRTLVGRMVFFDQARRQLLEKTRGNYPAPEKILAVVRRGLEEGFQVGMTAEAHAFGELLRTPQAEQLMGIFRAQTALKKDSGVDDPRAAARPITKLGVVGAGLMGAGIGYVSVAKAGTFVRLRDRDDAAVLRGLASLRAPLDKELRRKKLGRAELESTMARVTATTDWSGFADLPLIIEAVFEDLDLKHQVLRQVESVGHPDQIFASNTSSLPISKIAEVSQRPANVIGMHYFSPVEKMPLLEIIVTEKTAPWVIATCVQLGKQQGKTVIVVRDGAGFYTTRVLAPFLMEAAHMLSEGVAIDRIDAALVQFGFPVGPLKLTDEVGVDVGNKVCHVMHQAFGERMEEPPILSTMVKNQRLGRKSGTGFYLYGDKGKRGVDASVYSLLGIRLQPKHLSSEEIAWRCVLALVNETLRCFEEGIVRGARDADIGAVFGLGFPPFLGGPLHFVDSQGAASILQRLESYQARFGKRFEPPVLLRHMVEQRLTFFGERRAQAGGTLQRTGNGQSRDAVQTLS